MERRDFLRGALGTAALLGGAGAGTAHAATDPHIGAIRAAMLARQEQVQAALANLHRSADDDDDAEAVRTVLARGAGAVATLGDLDGLPVRLQVQPAAQALLREVAEQVGAALLLVQELLAPLADGTAAPPARLQAAWQEVTQIVLAVLPSDQHALGQRSLRRAQDQVEAGDLRGFARRMVRRIQALQRIALRASAEGGESPFLTRNDPALRREVQTHLAAAPPEADGRGGRATMTVVGILGLVACGALIYLGVIIIAYGVVSLLICPCVGVLILAAGMAIFVAAGIIGVLSVASLLGVSAASLRQRLDRQRREAATEALGTDVEQGDVVVQAAAGWVRTGVMLRRGDRHRVDARGQTHDPIHDAAPLGPGGDPGRLGGSGWRLPGAPEGALLGSTGEMPFLIGEARSLPEGHTGLLSLAINVEEARAPQRLGGLTVFVILAG